MDHDLAGDLREAFSQGFGSEPPHPPVAHRVRAGRRAVRRRRVVGTLVTVAVATAVGWGAVAVLAPGHDGPAQVATDPPPAEPQLPEDSTHYAEDGTLVIDPRAVVVQRIPNPLALELPDKSVALDLRHDDGELWLLLTYESDVNGGYGSMGSTGAPSTDLADFADWVEVQVQAQSNPTQDAGPYRLPRIPVRFDQGAHLSAVDGVRIVLQRPHPDLPESFAPAGARTAVALVEGRDGTRQWVLARDIGGFDVVKFPANRGADVDAFLDYARQQYDEGGAGLR